ncbi:MAG: glycerate kinase, partial [Actinobacteria bacterium]|nr:glycerate kinase [Actinomycetota bacterium]
ELQAAGHLVDGLPLADGGDGTIDVVLDHGFEGRETPTVDGHGRPRTGVIAWRGDEAIVEMAQVCGLATVIDLAPDPWRASSLGLGLAARAALDAGASSVTLALGGSASIDGGVGLLEGLGFTVLDRRGGQVTPDLAGLVKAHAIELRDVGGVWRVLVDVSNPLVGVQGAVRVFGPQKGLPPRDLPRVSAAMCRWASLLERVFAIEIVSTSGGGAAGGVAAAARASLGASIESGAEYVAGLTRLRERVHAAEVVVTGEGAFDHQSFGGKAPGLVIDIAREIGRPVFVVTGVSELADAEWRSRGVAGVITCSDLAGSLELARREPVRWLAAAAVQLAECLTPSS